MNHRLSSKRIRTNQDMMARICVFLQMAGGMLRKSELRQQMHAYRYGEMWNSAFIIMLNKGIITETGGSGGMVTLHRFPDSWMPTNRVRKPRRRRKRSQWFIDHLPEFCVRDGVPPDYYDTLRGQRVMEPYVPDTVYTNGLTTPHTQDRPSTMPSAPTEKPTPTLDAAQNHVLEPVQRTDELKPSGEPYFEPRNARTVFQFPSERCYEDAAIGGAEVMVDVLRNVDPSGDAVHIVTVVERPMGIGQPKRWMFRDDRGEWFDLWTKKPCFAPERPPTR